MNLGWIIELILPGLIHSNERVRDMVRFSLFYCVEPFAFTLPVNVAAMVESMKKIPFIAQNKEIIRIEILKFYYIISIKHSHSNIIYPSFIDKSISLLVDTLNYLKQCETGNVADQHENNIRFHFFQLCSKIFRENTESNYMTNEQYIELMEYILSYTGYGPLYNDRSPIENSFNHSKSTHHNYSHTLNFTMLRRREITPEMTFSQRAATVVSLPPNSEILIDIENNNAKRHQRTTKEISPKLVLEEPKSRN